jgi:predicted amidophosphoribosyltransferase
MSTGFKKRCPDCGKLIYARKVRCEECEAKMYEKDLWTCANCGEKQNTAEDLVCYRCFAPRPALTYIRMSEK